MKKLQKKDYLNLAILIGITLLVVILLTRFNFLYASKTDYESQHWVLAEYFRNLFYKTNDLLPDLALNIGAGQNIYNFAYYGFLNPIILFSYFLPFIKMIDYLMIASIIGFIASVILFYKFLLSHKFNSNIAFMGSFIFLCAAPLLFHSHRHIMFVNYMPFLIMGLMGVDKFFKANKKSLLIISIFLLIMTSYYYSVGSIIVLTIYGVTIYLKQENITFKTFLKKGSSFALAIITGILMSGILLIPIVGVILNGRSVKSVVGLREILLPNLNVNYLLYGSYSVGLTAIGIFALSSLFLKKDKSNRFLISSIMLMIIFPIFNYVLNGTLYLNAKAFIPFIPLICLIITDFINDLQVKKINLKPVIIINLGILLVTYFTNRFGSYQTYLFDSVIVISILLLFYKFNNKKILLSLLIFPLAIFIRVNLNDQLIKKADFKINFDEQKEVMVKNMQAEDQTFYRFNDLTKIFVNTNRVYNGDYYQTSIYSSTYNDYYNDYYNNVINNNIAFRNSLILASTNNIIFQSLMGVKYILVNNSLNQGYLLKMRDNYHIYENKTAYSLGYVTDKIISKKEFAKISYPYNIDALLDYAIIDNKNSINYQSQIQDVVLKTHIIKEENITLNKTTDIIDIVSSKDGYLELALDEVIKNRLLFIEFDMLLSQPCKAGDTSITINNISNKLTCQEWKYHNNNYKFSYVINAEEIKNLKIKFSQGSFKINNIKTYIMDYSKLEESYKTKDMLEDIKVNGDVITGNIDVKNNGYFILTLPYDKGYTIYLDQQKVTYELVNEAFIGFKIDKGSHQLKIEYAAPHKKIGFFISICGIVLLGIYLINDFKGVYLWKKSQS